MTKKLNWHEINYTADMREISGFGGGYEQACQSMVRVGIAWLEGHPKANPKFSTFEHIYGMIQEDNADAKTLSKAITTDDCTGAMHQAVISHILRIREVGWEAYKKEMIELKKEEGNKREQIEKLRLEDQ